MKKKPSRDPDLKERIPSVEEPAVGPGEPQSLLPQMIQAEVSQPRPSRLLVNVRTAKDQLSSLLERASEGEEIVITSDGRPQGMIVRFRPEAEGRMAESMAALRRAMAPASDSTALMRAERDAGF